MTIDRELIRISGNGYQLFQTIFTMLYEAFSKGKEIVIVRNGMDSTNWQNRERAIEESTGLSSHSYYHVKRILANLNLQGFAKVYKRKPEKPSDLKEGEKVYSYLEVRSTEKGFDAFKNGAICKIPQTIIYHYGKENSRLIDSIGIGKGYPGYDYLIETFFEPAKKNYSVAQSRWYDWKKAFNELFESKLANVETEEAKKEIAVLLEELVKTLPKRKTVADIQRNLEKCAKLPFA